MKRKLIIPMAIAVAAIASIWAISGLLPGNAGALVDIPSVIVAVLVPCLIALASFGPKKAIRARTAALDANASEEELKTAAAYFATLSRYLAAFAAIAFISGAIGALSLGTDANDRACGLAVAAVAPLYAAVFWAVLVLPFRAIVDARLAGLD